MWCATWVSIIGPILFIMYSAGLILVIGSYGLSPHMYTDDTQVYGSCRPAAADDFCERFPNVLVLSPAGTSICNTQSKNNKTILHFSYVVSTKFSTYFCFFSSNNWHTTYRIFGHQCLDISVFILYIWWYSRYSVCSLRWKYKCVIVLSPFSAPRWIHHAIVAATATWRGCPMDS